MIPLPQYCYFSRLSRLEVKWTNLVKGNAELYQIDHVNPYFEIIMVVEGPVYLRVGEENLTLKTGEIFILNRWEHHSGWRKINEEAGFFWVQFECDPEIRMTDSWTEMIDKINILQPKDELRTAKPGVNDYILLPRRYMPDRKYRLLSMFENLMHEFIRPHGYFRFRLSMQLGIILETIASDWLDRNYNYADNSPPLSFITYRRLVSYLDENYRYNITRADIEKAVGKSYEYLCNVFKKNSGMTINKYIHQLRIQHAKYLLVNMDGPIANIAEELGYRDPMYFTRIFTKMVGMSPTKYRQTREIMHSKEHYY